MCPVRGDGVPHLAVLPLLRHLELYSLCVVLSLCYPWSSSHGAQSCTVPKLLSCPGHPLSLQVTSRDAQGDVCVLVCFWYYEHLAIRFTGSQGVEDSAWSREKESRG